MVLNKTGSLIESEEMTGSKRRPGSNADINTSSMQVNKKQHYGSIYTGKIHRSMYILLTVVSLNVLYTWLTNTRKQFS